MSFIQIIQPDLLIDTPGSETVLQDAVTVIQSRWRMDVSGPDRHDRRLSGRTRAPGTASITRVKDDASMPRL